MRKMNDGQSARGAHSKAGLADGGDAAVLSALAKAALAQQKSASSQAGADQGQPAQPDTAQSDVFDAGASAVQSFGFGEPQAYAAPAPQYETQLQVQPADFIQAQPQPQPSVAPVPQAAVQPISQPVLTGQAQEGGFSVAPVGAHSASAASAVSVASTSAAATGAHSAGADGKSAAFIGEKGAHTASAGAKGETTATSEKEKSPEKGAHAAAGAKKKKRAPLIIALAVVCVAAIAGAAWFFVSHSVPDTEAVKVVEKALDSAKSASGSTVAQLIEKDAGESLSRYGIDTASLASWLQKDMSCKVTKLDEQGSTATVTVKATCHDLPQFQECITAVAKEAATSTDFQSITTADDAYKLIGTKAFERAKSESPASKSFEVKLVKKGDTWELANEDESAILSQLWE